MRHTVRRRLLFLTAPVIILVAGLAAKADQPAEAAFPGLNGKIAFAAARSGTWEIDLMNPDGTGRAKLPTSTGLDFEPAWSPDGTKIADVCSNFAICVMHADGSAQRA
jgi:WD40-like Beta Propeller Repeat